MPHSLSLSTSLSDLSIPKKFLDILARLHIYRIEDLLFHTPRKYSDYSRRVSIAELETLEANSQVTIIGTVISKYQKKIPGKTLRIIEVTFEDDTGRVKAVWFNQQFILKQAKEGARMAVAGTVSRDGHISLREAVLEPVKAGKSLLHTGRLVPEYSTTKGITSRFFRYHIALLLTSSYLPFDDYLPENLRETYEVDHLFRALRQVHFPQTREEVERGQYRLAFEEAFFLQLSLLQQRMHLQTFTATPLSFKKEEIQSFVSELPFDLTNAQRKTAWEIIKDTGTTLPMNRLLEGDVGSGKTIVATIALLNTALNNQQAAFMAPTEVLALQHFERLVGLFHQTSFIQVPKVAVLTGSQARVSTDPNLGSWTKVDRKTLLRQISSGEVHIVIGTHALISEYLTFQNLTFTLIDEQHRFGVNQRARLQEKGVALSPYAHTMPHLLSMTATPIPRTLALTAYGDLLISRISERPPKRRLPVTRVVAESDRAKAYQFLRDNLAQGEQLFVVCPQIEESEDSSTRSVFTEYERLQNDVYADFPVAMLHGQMPQDEKQQVISAFQQKEYAVLVSTTVIEVGVDLPEVNLMLIESAERFGLAQLHQLRGRVGRGGGQAYCFVAASGEDQPERLQALEQTTDGFELAEYDLTYRGPGQFTGGEQSGYSSLRPEIFTDAELLDAARSGAHSIISDDPTLHQYPDLRTKLERFQQTMHIE
jgi:ATP-dependent DNA helicase RecG